jgi:hypothetical protein
VTRELTAVMTYQASFDRVRAMFIDPEYVAAKAASLDGTEIVAEVSPTPEGGNIVVCGRSIPADVPPAAKPFVGERITVTETHTWSRPVSPTEQHGSVKVGFSGAPVSVTGTIRLIGDASSATATLDLTVSASVPFFGPKLEEIVGDQLENAVSYEQKIGRAWLSR